MEVAKFAIGMKRTNRQKVKVVMPDVTESSRGWHSNYSAVYIDADEDEITKSIFLAIRKHGLIKFIHNDDNTIVGYLNVWVDKCKINELNKIK